MLELHLGYDMQKRNKFKCRDACSFQKCTAENAKIHHVKVFPKLPQIRMCRNVCTRDTWFFFHFTNFKFLFWLRNVIHTATGIHKHWSAGVQKKPSWWDEDNILHSFSSITNWIVCCITATQLILPELLPKFFWLERRDSSRLRKVTQSYCVRYSNRVLKIFRSCTRDLVFAPSWCHKGSR